MTTAQIYRKALEVEASLIAGEVTDLPDMDDEELQEDETETDESVFPEKTD